MSVSRWSLLATTLLSVAFAAPTTAQESQPTSRPASQPTSRPAKPQLPPLGAPAGVFGAGVKLDTATPLPQGADPRCAGHTGVLGQARERPTTPTPSRMRAAATASPAVAPAPAMAGGGRSQSTTKDLISSFRTRE